MGRRKTPPLGRCALQDADKHDDVPGEGHGYINMFDTAGTFIRRVAEKGQLNSPWGLALAPDDFGKFSGDLLVGNFGDGRIHAFEPDKVTGRGEFHHRGPLHSAAGPPIEIDGLWGLSFGNGANARPKNVLFFTAGPFHEQHGLFGKLTAVPPPGRQR
ncbi:MAG TPA: TIGR03118 family protein [Acidobacteriota bacterium]|nr:TIGR03118 family protein [Acidobacteriota bacterium]